MALLLTVDVRASGERSSDSETPELNIILGDMIAELNVGHAYVFGGDISEPEQVGTGHLGADLEPDPGGKAWRATCPVMPSTSRIARRFSRRS